jgi:signal recognition particle subunit SRP54
MFERLSDRLEATIKNLRGDGKLTEENVTEALRDVRRAFLEADVSFQVTKEFVAAVKEKALGTEVLQSVTPGQMIVKIIHDELVAVMGGVTEEMTFQGKPPVGILMCGLQGSGKTTFAGKLALWARSKRKRKVLLVAADVYRPAAIQQLQVLGKSLGIEVYQEGLGDPVEICRNGLEHAKKNGFDTVFYDTAGRLQVDDDLMKELENIRQAVHPQEILFVADAMIGQEAVNVAEVFHQRLAFTGICLSKMDGDARGGAALSIRRAAGVPVRFVGTGEKLHEIEVFHPDRLAGRILGMGDVVSLVEMAQEVIDEKDARSMARKMMDNSFNLQDFMDQLRTVKKMGPLKNVIGMLPGMKGMGDMVDDKQMLHVEAILSSMTKRERHEPRILNGQRRKRIASGSGTTVQKVNQVIAQFDQMKTMMKQMGKMQEKMKGKKMSGPGALAALRGGFR